MQKVSKILIGPSSFAVLDKTPMEQLISEGYEVIDNPFKRKLTRKELLDLLSPDVIGLIAGLETLDREILKQSNLKVISRVGSGLSNIDIDAAGDLGISVCYTPYGPTTAVAELVLGAMISLIRMIPLMDHDMHIKKWNKRIGFQLEGKTVVIIGYGRIGKKVAELLSSFNVNILVVDPFCKEVIRDYTVLSVEMALPKADIITIHSSEDKCILGDEEFSIIKSGAYLLNAARGNLISESSLIKALDSGKVKGVWMDTFENEPYDGPLTEYEQVVLTPHIGSYTAECRKQMETEAVENLINAL
jgi:D-3-phosphoglycerate dehydrogenase|tara:strand:+ start:90 stop:998 length:909 start_codon:yes stop_codon:yes gene_type:complete